MSFRSFVSMVLCCSLLLTTVPTSLWSEVALAATFPVGGYCASYKTHYDRTKVPNYPLSAYMDEIDANDTSKRNQRLLEVKSDNLCMHAADLERKRTKTSDTALRAALTKQLESLAAEQQTVNDNLRAITERAERLAKLADTLRALARDGNVAVMQQLTDRRAAIVETLATSYETEIAKIAADQDRSTVIAKNLSAYEKLSATEKLAEQARLKNVVQTAYANLNQQVNALKQEFTTTIMGSVVDGLLAEERATYITAMEAAVTDPAERTAQASAIDAVITEKKAIYREKLQSILDSSFAEVEAISGVIREQLKLPAAATTHSPDLSRQTAVLGGALLAGFLEDFQQSFGKALQGKMDELLTGYVPKVQKLSADALVLHASNELALIKIIGNAEKAKQLYALAEAGNMKAFQNGLQALEKPVQDRITSVVKKMRADAHADDTATLTKNGGKFTPVLNITKQNVTAACSARPVLHTQKNTCDGILQLIGEVGFNSTTVKLLDTFEKSEILRKNIVNITAFIQKEVTWYKAEIQKPKTLLRGAKAAEIKWLLIQKIIATPSVALSGGTPKEIAARKKDLALYQAYRTKLIAGEAKNWLSAHPVCGATQTSWFQSLKAVPGSVVIAGECRDLPWAQLMRENGVTAKKGTKVPAPVVTYVDGSEVTTDAAYGTSIRKKNGRTEAVAILNRSGKPILMVDSGGFVTALAYDASGYLIERKKALLAIDSRANAWDGEWLFRNAPELAERVTWSYRDGVVRGRTEFDVLNNAVSKTIRYTYLNEEIGTVIPTVQQAIKRNPSFAKSNLAKITISDQHNVIAREAIFLYNQHLQRLAIQSKDSFATRTVFLLADDLVHRTYPDMVKHSSVVGVTGARMYSIDHEGNIWDNQQKLLSGRQIGVLLAATDHSWFGIFPEYVNDPIAVGEKVGIDEATVCESTKSDIDSSIINIKKYEGFRQLASVRARECNWGKSDGGNKHTLYISNMHRYQYTIDSCPISWSKDFIPSSVLAATYDANRSIEHSSNQKLLSLAGSKDQSAKLNLKDLDPVFRGDDIDAMLVAGSTKSPFVKMAEHEPDFAQNNSKTAIYQVEIADEMLVYAGEDDSGEVWLAPYVVWPAELTEFITTESRLSSFPSPYINKERFQLPRAPINISTIAKLDKKKKQKACYGK